MQIERRSLHKSLSELQSNYQAQMDRKTIGGGLRRFAESLGHTPRVCQFPVREVTKQELRRGSDAWKCGAPARDEKPYCEYHCSRAYIQKPLTEDEEPTPSVHG